MSDNDHLVYGRNESTAYDRAQQKRNEDVYNIDALVRELALDAIKQRARLDASFGRIEALELEVARLKGPQPGVWQKMPGTTVNVEVDGNKVIMKRTPTLLDCGCVDECRGHQ